MALRSPYSVPILDIAVDNTGPVTETLAVGYTWVMRDLIVDGECSGISAFEWVLNGLSVVNWFAPSFWAGNFEWHGRLVAPGGSIVTFAAGPGTCVFHVHLSGYQLTGP